MQNIDRAGHHGHYTITAGAIAARITYNLDGETGHQPEGPGTGDRGTSLAPTFIMDTQTGPDLLDQFEIWEMAGTDSDILIISASVQEVLCLTDTDGMPLISEASLDVVATLTEDGDYITVGQHKISMQDGAVVLFLNVEKLEATPQPLYTEQVHGLSTIEAFELMSVVWFITDAIMSTSHTFQGGSDMSLDLKKRGRGRKPGWRGRRFIQYSATGPDGQPLDARWKRGGHHDEVVHIDRPDILRRHLSPLCRCDQTTGCICGLGVKTRPASTDHIGGGTVLLC